MNMSFYSAAVGAYQQQLRMDVQAHNIANVNTQGYRCERAAFGELMNRDVDGINGNNLPKGTGARMIHAPIDTSTRGFKETGMTFDFAINGNGFFALYDPATQEISFTRDGAFEMNEFQLPAAADAEPEYDEDGNEIEPQPTTVWRLSDNFGRCVLDPQGNFIVIDPANREADLDVGVFDYNIHYGMLHTSDNRLVSTDVNGQLYLGTGQVMRGLLEMSNTDLTQEFIKVIESQRAFSYCLKMVTTTDEIESTFNSLRG